MPDENAVPQNEETPQGTTAPQEDTAAEDHKVVDYRSRYENLLPEFTKKSQRLAELEAQLEKQGDDQYEYDFEDDEGYEEYSPQDLQKLVRAETEAALSRRDQEQKKVQDEIAFVNAEIARLEKERSEEFSDEEWDYIGRVSEESRDEHGRPDVERAYEHFSNLIEGRKKKWYSGKRSSRPANGPGAAEVVDLDDSQARAEFIDRVMEANIDPD